MDVNLLTILTQHPKVICRSHSAVAHRQIQDPAIEKTCFINHNCDIGVNITLVLNVCKDNICIKIITHILSILAAPYLRNNFGRKMLWAFPYVGLFCGGNFATLFPCKKFDCLPLEVVFLLGKI